MSYMGGQWVVGCLLQGRTENGIWITCQECQREKQLRIPHHTKNKVAIAMFRKSGWTCTDRGFRARCPKCAGKR